MTTTAIAITFNQWAEDFMVRFSKFSEMLAESDLFRDDFRDTFRPFAIEVLQKATRELTLLDPAPYPNQIFGMLHTRCKSMTMLPKMHDKVIDPWDEPRYKCLDCCDSGALQVYHPIGYSPIRSGTFQVSKHLNSIMVACTCGEGDHMAASRQSKGEKIVPGLKRFNKRTMKVITATRINEQVDELTEFVLSGYQKQFSGFEDYQ